MTLTELYAVLPRAQHINVIVHDRDVFIYRPTRIIIARLDDDDQIRVIDVRTRYEIESSL